MSCLRKTRWLSMRKQIQECLQETTIRHLQSKYNKEGLKPFEKREDYREHSRLPVDKKLL